MDAHVTTQRNGTVLLRLDREAASATFASIVFASRYHEGIRGLEEIAKKALAEGAKPIDQRKATCR